MKKNFLLFSIIIVVIFFIVLVFVRQPACPAESADVLIVGTNAEYAPFTFIDNDHIVGFDIDLITEVARRLGKEIEIKDLPFDALIPEAQLGMIQVIAAGISATPEREKNLLFTAPYLSGDTLVIMSMKGTTTEIKTVQDLAGKTVLVNEGFVADFYMSAYKDIHLIRLGTVSEALLALRAGRAAAFITAGNSIRAFLENEGKNSFAIHPIPGTSEHYSFGISKKHSSLFPLVEHFLAEMKNDGFIEELKAKWRIV